jgi:hypothetical protein
MIGRAALVLGMAWVLSGSLWAQQKNPPPPPGPKVDEAKVEAAIKNGMEYLRARGTKFGGGKTGMRELVLLTLVHGGARRGDPLFDELLQAMLEEELRFTYRVSLQAMILEEVDRIGFQRQLFRCGQFLVDNQCANGQWSYGEPTTYLEPSIGTSRDVATGPAFEPNKVVVFGDAAAGPAQKPAVRMKIPVKKQRDGPDHGDNSNSQYAALGLRACHDSGIVLPRETVEKASQWWRESQIGNPPPPVKGAKVATGPNAPPVEPHGWSYESGGKAYGSMTAGAVGARTICDYILGTDWKKDDIATAGINWLRDHFSVSENPDHGGKWHYYYLYGLERACVLYGTDKLGKTDWYYEGAKYLLDNQDADGGWSSLQDTCFAILFLKKATRSLVESRSASGKK